MNVIVSSLDSIAFPVVVCRELLIYAAFGILKCPLQCEFQEKSVMLTVGGFTPEALPEGSSHHLFPDECGAYCSRPGMNPVCFEDLSNSRIANG